jgi:hypothetical protein
VEEVTRFLITMRSEMHLGHTCNEYYQPTEANAPPPPAEANAPPPPAEANAPLLELTDVLLSSLSS